MQHHTLRWNYPVVVLDGRAYWLDEAPEIKLVDLDTGEHPCDARGEPYPVMRANAIDGWIEMESGDFRRPHVERIGGRFAIISDLPEETPDA
uniref:Uncharacterized protein n=1 Tax=Caulobacter phage BL57 TaxID=3348355 RepID=A0AB74UL43_9VIRU